MVIRTEVEAVRSTFLRGNSSKNFQEALRGTLQVGDGVRRTEKAGLKLGGC